MSNPLRLTVAIAIAFFTSSVQAQSRKVVPQHTKTSIGQTPVSFNNDVESILTRRGCNQGSCHGAQYGKGSFKLSLAGFDADLDYINIARQSKGRRISVSDPARCLFIAKPAMQVAHGGGLRLETGTPDFLVRMR